jgi:hypothetical protein
MNNKLIKTIVTVGILLSIFVFIFISYNADVEALRSIDVSLDKIDLYDIKFTSFKLKLNVNISNPTNNYLSNLSSEFDIYIDENFVGEGDFTNVTIPALSNRSKDIIVTIYYGGLADAVVDIIKNVITNEEFYLTINGELSGNALFGLTKVSQSFQATQTFP